jgi:hypothetical protein
MATQDTVVPVNGNKNEMDGWLENVSQHIDAGNSVEFIDDTGADINISRVQLDTAGSIAVWGKGYAQNTAKRVALTAGIWHEIPGIHGFDAANTDTGKGIHVKI